MTRVNALRSQLQLPRKLCKNNSLNQLPEVLPCMSRLCEPLTHRWTAVILKISVEGDRREDFIMLPKQLAFPNMSLDVGQVWGIREDCCGITRRKETQPSVEQQVYRDSPCPIPAPLYSSQPCTWKSHPCFCSSQLLFFSAGRIRKEFPSPCPTTVCGQHTGHLRIQSAYLFSNVPTLVYRTQITETGVFVPVLSCRLPCNRTVCV